MPLLGSSRRRPEANPDAPDPAGVLHIYYGLTPQVGNGGLGGCTSTSVNGEDQSGASLIGRADLQYDTSDIPGGTYYDNYAHGIDLIGALPITRLALMLDSGWDGDERLTLTSATVNDNTFTPTPASAQGQTCNLPAATIKITKTDGLASGDVNEPLTIQPRHSSSSSWPAWCSCPLRGLNRPALDELAQGLGTEPSY